MRNFLTIFILSCSVCLCADRGTLLSYSLISRLSNTDVNALMRQENVASLGKSVCGVEIYKLSYETIDPHGKSCKATGAVIVPMGLKKAPPVLSFSHGTMSNRYDVPSDVNFQIRTAIAAFSSGGYLITAADYLGLGGSDLSYHPYCHAASLVSSNVDMLKATKALCKKIGQPISDALFISGYSEGGMAAMALHREIEKNPMSGFTLKAAAPMSGPYDLAGGTLSGNMNIPGPRASTYVAYLLFGYNLVYPDCLSSFNSVFVDPFASLIPAFFDGSHSMFEVERELSLPPKHLVQPQFMQELVQNPKAPLLARLQENETFQWAPKVPTALIGVKGDQDVPFANSETAYAWMKNKGGNVFLLNMGESLDHITGKAACHGAARQFFDNYNKK